LPVSTPGELAALITKIRAYEAAPAVKLPEALLLADAADQAGDFPADSAALAPVLAGRYATSLLALVPPATADDVRNALLDRFNPGFELLNYLGHGGLDQLGIDGFLTSDDVAGLGDATRPPLLVAMTCVAADFAEPADTCLGETLVLEAHGGAIAMWGPTGLSLNADARVLNRLFLQDLEAGRHRRLGDFVLTAVNSYQAGPVRATPPWIYNLIGDPALEVRVIKQR
jgi:hypothetical protein